MSELALGECAAKCIVCKTTLRNFEEDGFNHPMGGLEFTTRGHYGSAVFDPMDGTHLSINICDGCLRRAGEEGNVLLGFPRPAPPPSPMMRWPLVVVESEAALSASEREP